MYDAIDIHGFYCLGVCDTQKQLEEYQSIINELKQENSKLQQDNAVLAALVRATTGINYISDYE